MQNVAAVADGGELHLRLGERVRLTDEFQGISKGAEGIIRGFYRDEPHGYAVDFAGPLRRVPPEYVESVEPEQS